MELTNWYKDKELTQLTGRKFFGEDDKIYFPIKISINDDTINLITSSVKVAGSRETAGVTFYWKNSKSTLKSK